MRVWTALVLVVLLGVVVGVKALTEEEIINQVNSGDYGWRAGPLPEGFEREGKVMPGWKLGRMEQKLKELMGKVVRPESTTPPPDSFDWRDESPDCVGYVRNQGSCGSCWAFGCAESLSDRFCIHSQGSVKVNLTTEELVACNLDGLEGCHGGEPVSAFTYAALRGLATEECVPYLFINGTGPSCSQVPTTECADGSQFIRYHSILDSLRWHPDESLMQNEILTNGPIEACFEVYEDFMNYQSGVYTHVNGSFVGGHCIKIVGWGTYNDSTPYWIAQNSWTDTWGLQGYFLIKRGVDECGIEREAFSALPNLSNSFVSHQNN